MWKRLLPSFSPSSLLRYDTLKSGDDAQCPVLPGYANANANALQLLAAVEEYEEPEGFVR